jgi:hypothetical protein
METRDSEVPNSTIALAFGALAVLKGLVLTFNHSDMTSLCAQANHPRIRYPHGSMMRQLSGAPGKIQRG